MNKSTKPLAVLAAGLLCTAGAHAATPASEPAAAAQADAQAEKTEKPGCLQQTGSRLRATEERPCLGGPGQVITREQLDRTGATTVSDAIRRASPSVN